MDTPLFTYRLLRVWDFKRETRYIKDTSLLGGGGSMSDDYAHTNDAESGER